VNRCVGKPKLQCIVAGGLGNPHCGQFDQLQTMQLAPGPVFARLLAMFGSTQSCPTLLIRNEKIGRRELFHLIRNSFRLMSLSHQLRKQCHRLKNIGLTFFYA
jgi:hypothetical protein